MKSPRSNRRRPTGAAKRAVAPEAANAPSRAPQAVMVLGMHRSGTSAITRVFNLLGAALPTNLLGANSTNEGGHWESIDLINIHDELLQTAGTRWDDWRAFNPEWIQSGLSEVHKKALLDILRRDFNGAPLFVLKDPRICRFVPVWIEVLERFGAQAHYVIPVRNPLEVAASLKRRNEIAPALSYLLWLRHVLDAERMTRHMPRAIISYEDLLGDWRGVVTTVTTKTGIHWPRRSDRSELEIDQFLADTLRHHEANTSQLAVREDIARWVKDVYPIMLQMAGGREAGDQFKQLDRIYREFDAAADAFGRVLAGETANLEQQLQTRETQIKATTDETIRLSEQLIQAQAAAEDVQNVVAETQRRLSEAQASAQSKIQQRDLEAVRLIQDIETARSYLRESQTQVQRLAGELDHAQREIERTDVDRRRITEELIMVRETARREADESARREIEHDERAAQRIEQSEKRVRDLADELGQAKRNIEQVDAERRRVAEELTSAREAARREVQRMVPQIENLTGALQAARHQVSAMEAELAKSVSKLDERDRHANKLSRELEISRSLAEGLRAAVREQIRFTAATSQQLRDDKPTPWQKIVRHIRPPRSDAATEHSWEFEVIRTSPLFDSQWYFEKNPDVAKAGKDALWHYIVYGAAEGRSPHPLFDEAWYRGQHMVPLETRMTSLTHYLMLGQSESANPGPLFDTAFYLNQGPDLSATRGNALLHYLKLGAYEGLDPHPLFDSSWYLERSPDVVVAGDNPAVHYVVHGWKTGRDPHPDFDSSWYLDQYPDVAAAGMNPLLHYLEFGWKEGLDPSPGFDSDRYLSRNPDVRDSGVNPLVHYVLAGRSEGRDGKR